MESSIASRLELVDFIIYRINSTSSTAAAIPLQYIDTAAKSLCIFDSECQQSKLLDRIGFNVLYQPCTEKDIVLKIKEELAARLALTKQKASPRRDEKALVFASSDQYLMVEKEKLVHATSSGNYTTLYLSNQKEITVTKQLGKVAEKLPEEEFFRVHHSHLINRAFIKTVLKQGHLQVVLENQFKIPVSRRRKRDFLHWLGLN